MTIPKIPERPTWPQLILLVSALSTGGYFGGRASAEPEGHKDDTALIQSIGDLKKSVEKLTDQVNVLNTRMAVVEALQVEDRQKRSGK